MNDAGNRRYGLLADVAELYFLKGLNQAEIAEKMNISRSLVSRHISEAQAKGIVSITINRFFERNVRLENSLADRFGLPEACVLSLPSAMSPSEKKRYLGLFAADIIYRRLPGGGLLGLTFGTTLLQAVEALAMKPPVCVGCVQLTGSLGAADAAFDAHQLVQRLSVAWNCPGVYLHAPYIVGSEEVKRQLFGSRSNSAALEAGRKLSAAVVGLSPLGLDGKNSALFTGGHITAEDMRIMRENGVVGDIGAYSVDRDGKLVETANLIRMTGLDEDEFKTIKMRYGLAIGEYKVNIIRAALRGGWFTSLIIDDKTAEAVLAE